MQAARHAGALQALGLRPITNLKNILLLPLAASFATHGVGEGVSTQGVPRFYKTVHVKEALDQVPPPLPPLPPLPPAAACCPLPVLTAAQGQSLNLNTPLTILSGGLPSHA